MTAPFRHSVIWLNGKITPAEDARISPFDRGFLLGDGVFETLCASKGRAFAITRHWERLCISCGILDLEPPAREVFRSALDSVLSVNNLKEARLRFTISRGEEPSGAPTMLATATQLNIWPPMAKIATVPWPRNDRSPLASAKSISYVENLLAHNWARKQGADEGVFINTQGHLCEGTSSNIFCVQNGTLLTPAISSGCLAGITRALVLELAHKAGINVEETSLPPASLAELDEAFLTSSTRKVQPIGEIDSGTPSHSPGPITQRLAELFQQLANDRADP